MIANKMYTIDVPTDESFLASSKNIMVVSTIFQQAISKYLTIYKTTKKTLVPLSFIEFYINEIRNYSYMFRKQTKGLHLTFYKKSSVLDASIKKRMHSQKAMHTQFKKVYPFYLIISNSAPAAKSAPLCELRAVKRM